MLQARWTASLAIGLLLSATGSADEVGLSAKNDESITAAPLALDYFLLESAYGPFWQPAPIIEALDYSDDWQQPIADIYFPDGSIYGRVSRIRSLRLFTLAEDDKSRLFLGINEKGFLGLHFGAHPSIDDKDEPRVKSTLVHDADETAVEEQ